MAERYGIPPALLAGVVSAENDFDRDFSDLVMDKIAKAGMGIFDGPGIASVHNNSL